MSTKFEDIYSTKKNKVYNLALHYAQNKEDAEEIMQNVFVSVFQNHEKFKEEATIDTWIYRITINKSIDFLKAKKRKKRLGPLYNLFFDDTFNIRHDTKGFDHPGVLFEQQEAVKHIFVQLNLLPERQKTVLILCKIEHQSIEKVAEILSLSPKATESLLQRAKVNLQKRLVQNEGKKPE